MNALVMAFFKAPRPGTVKTRLGREIGHEPATALYRRMAEEQLARIPAEMRAEVHYAPRGAKPDMTEWLGKRHYRAQAGGDLGARLNHAFLTGFRRGYRPVLAIGADCPDLDAACLRRAVLLLGSHDVVLGPATDGGYYLIGLRAPAPRLFADIEWSTSTVLADTVQRAKAGGLSVAQLEERLDIDDLASLKQHLGTGLPPVVAL
ncbi:MAG: TIGR04282 family arsenosugar biosynthesis glycosyltransferase [Opitutae bacterium]|nr:TIGR04282 family arsenosugar biosynthesis glycosyltransferase [Opitutae bacterium]